MKKHKPGKSNSFADDDYQTSFSEANFFIKSLHFVL